MHTNNTGQLTWTEWIAIALARKMHGRCMHWRIASHTYRLRAGIYLQEDGSPSPSGFPDQDGLDDECVEKQNAHSEWP